MGWGGGVVASYPLLSQAPTPVEVELGCDKKSQMPKLNTIVPRLVEDYWALKFAECLQETNFGGLLSFLYHHLIYCFHIFRWFNIISCSTINKFRGSLLSILVYWPSIHNPVSHKQLCTLNNSSPQQTQSPTGRAKEPNWTGLGLTRCISCGPKTEATGDHLG